MDFLDIIKTRRSIREYQDKAIPKEALEKIVDAARFAATARNVQPWEFVVVTAKVNLEKIAELAENGRFIKEAHACIAIFSIDTKYYLEDGCAATENVMLAARALGIGSCWVAGDKKTYCVDIAKLLNVPDSYKLVSLISLGYPKSEKEFNLKEKRALKDLIHWERF